MADPVGGSTPTPAEDIGEFEWALVREGLATELASLTNQPGDYAAGWRQGMQSSLDRMDSVARLAREAREKATALIEQSASGKEGRTDV